MISYASEFNDLESNENTDTNYDLTEADLRELRREIYKEECDPQLEVYDYELIQLRVV